jgi:hypothetical protein
MIRYIPIQVHDDGRHCGECKAQGYMRGEYCSAFHARLNPEDPTKWNSPIKRCLQCLAQAKEIVPDDELTALRAQVEALRRALHEIAEEWAGSECGVPVYAQEAYAIGLAKRMYELAVEAMKGQS